MIPKWKADPETAWLKEADSMALQQSLRDLGKAYGNFFRAPGKVGFPRFKSKRAMRGGAVARVGRFYPSSKACSACGHVLEELPLSARKWKCPVCGAVHDRDVNAARNILVEGLRILKGQGTAGLAGTAA